MSGNVHWVLELNIKDGALDDFKALMGEMVTATKTNEPDAMNYEWFISGLAKTPPSAFEDTLFADRWFRATD